MKNIGFLLILISMSGACFGQGFHVDPKMTSAPGKFVWVDNGKKAMNYAEISVEEYLNFLAKITEDSSESYVAQFKPGADCALFPAIEWESYQVQEKGRTVSWINEEKFKTSSGYEKGRYRDSYKKPITGLTYEQVVGFAEWCTSYYNNWLDMNKSYSNRVIVFRLPTPQEFEDIERKGMEVCYSEYTKEEREQRLKYLLECKNRLKCALCNVTDKDSCESNIKMIEKAGNGLYPVYTFFPNCYGIYNMQGNAAEMTSQKCIAKGGSYLSTAKETAPESVQYYNGSASWLGFRLIAEVVPVDGVNVSFDDEGFLTVKKK